MIEEAPQIIGSIFPNPAIMTNTCFTLFVKNCRPAAPVQWDHAEDLVTRLVPVTDLRQLMAAGQIRHALVAVAFWGVGGAKTLSLKGARSGRVICNLESGAACLIQPQRHHRAARFRQAVAGEVTDPVQDTGQLGVLALARLELLGGAELHQNSGEGLGQTVVNFLAYAGTLNENRGFFR